jgi:hypothetical protein
MWRTTFAQLADAFRLATGSPGSVLANYQRTDAVPRNDLTDDTRSAW